MSHFFIFFSIPIVTTYDSAGYHRYTEILFSSKGWQNWDYFRGVTVPIFIEIAHLLFGYSSQGLVTAMYLISLLTLLGAVKFQETLIERRNSAYLLIGFVLILFDPILISYFHLLLPEALTIPALFAVYYLASEDLTLLGAVLVGCILFLLFQIKEPQVIIPFCFVMLLATKNLKLGRHAQVWRIFLSVIVFSSLTLILSTVLNHQTAQKNYSKPNSATLVRGLGYAGLSGALFSDNHAMPYNLVQKIQTINSNIQIDSEITDCHINGSRNAIYFLKTGAKLKCIEPETLLQAVKLRAYFTLHFPFQTLNTGIQAFAETFRAKKNRYDEIRILPALVASLPIGISNISQIFDENATEYTEYVKPYEILSRRPVGVFGKADLAMLNAFVYIYPFTFLLMIGWLIVAVSKNRLLEANALWIISIFCYLAFNSFIGLIDDRYTLIAYPSALLYSVDLLSSLSKILIPYLKFAVHRKSLVNLI